MRLLNIYEVMSYGPIVHANDDYGLLVTVNGCYFNLFFSYDNKHWECRDTVYNVKELYDTSFAEMWDYCERYDWLRLEESE